MNIVPFSAGDTIGKSGEAIDDAVKQMANCEAGSARHKLYEMQRLVAEELPPVDCPLQHVFAPGAVARTIFIPKGTVIVGKIHRHAHLNILSQGSVTVYTEHGGTEDFTGPLTMVSPAGTKRGLIAHTNVVWTTIHLTDKTDLAEIEEEIIAKSYNDLVGFKSLEAL